MDQFTKCLICEGEYPRKAAKCPHCERTYLEQSDETMKEDREKQEAERLKREEEKRAIETLKSFGISSKTIERIRKKTTFAPPPEEYEPEPRISGRRGRR